LGGPASATATPSTAEAEAALDGAHTELLLGALQRPPAMTVRLGGGADRALAVVLIA